MGRSYSEHPFHEQQPSMNVQGSGPRLGNDEDQQKLGQQKPALPDLPGGYRQPHAETIKRYQRRAARKAAGGQAAAAKKAPAAKKAAPVKKAAPAAKKAAPAAKKAAPVAKRAAPVARPAPAARALPAGKPAAKKGGALVALATARGGKTVSRVAAAAKTVVQRVTKKVGARKGPKKR